MIRRGEELFIWLAVSEGSEVSRYTRGEGNDRGCVVRTVKCLCVVVGKDELDKGCLFLHSMINLYRIDSEDCYTLRAIL